MIEHRTEFKEGELVVLTSGSYSDYYIEGLFRVSKTFDIKDFPSGRSGYYSPRFDSQRLINEGFLVDVDYTELWVGEGYG